MPLEDYGFGSKNTGKTYSGGSKEVSGGYSYDGGDSSPSIVDRITSFFTRNDDPSPAPQPVSGGRGNVYERPNERNDYLAAILQQQSDNAVVPPPSAYDAQVGLRANAGYVNPMDFNSGLQMVPNQQQPDYLGNNDIYSIPVGQYIPPQFRSAANYLGLNDLSNLNPVTTMFTRPRDAAARYADPEKYSPTGQRETSDLLEAGMGPLEAFIGLGTSRFLREPIERGLGALFGIEVDAPTPIRSDETLRLYHGTPSEGFNPEQKVRMPDGSIQYIDMFQVAGGRPGDLSTLESMAPPGAEVLETYPYGRLTTEFIGTGEAGFKKGSKEAEEDTKGALAGKGIYFGSNPNISQHYRYINSSGIPYVPYKDSKKDGVGQETLDVVQPAIIDQYGSLDKALETYNFGDDDVFSFTVGDEVFSFKTPASVREEVDKNFGNVLDAVKTDPVMSQYMPETTATSANRATVDKVSKNMQQKLKQLRPEYLGLQERTEEIDGMFPLARSDEDRMELYERFLSPEEFSLYKEYDDVSGALFRLNAERAVANQPVGQLREDNKILSKILDLPVEEIPGSLFFTDIAESNMNKYLDLGDPNRTFYFSPDREVQGEVDIGTLNDMVNIFGKDWVEKRLAGLPTDRAWQVVGDGPVSVLEETGNPNLPYRVQDSSQEGRSVVATENVFMPRTVNEMKKLAEAGYTNLRFLDATSRRLGDDPSYNYVFFGDDVMPKIVDKKKEGGAVGMGIGSL